MNPSKPKSLLPHFQRYLLTGMLTFIPLWVTWIIFEFLLIQLSKLGRPFISVVVSLFAAQGTTFAAVLLSPWVQFTLAVLLTIAFFYVLGVATTKVIGRKLIQVFDDMLERLPLIKNVYGSTKRFLSVVQAKPEKAQRVVLIKFPNPDMRAIGLVTKTFTDVDTGAALAAVYVPTTPNPTSGYLEIVPVADLVPTDWTLDEAMSFIVTGGALAPDRIKYTGASDDRMP
ncbi:MAG TPA: DUF502 domain-containing protein [Burkholderiales bacterium]|nr:DUF502 domain-containing protein [Burkholderiales bacterium]